MVLLETSNRGSEVVVSSVNSLDINVLDICVHGRGVVSSADVVSSATTVVRSASSVGVGCTDEVDSWSASSYGLVV